MNKGVLQNSRVQQMMATSNNNNNNNNNNPSSLWNINNLMMMRPPFIPSSPSSNSNSNSNSNSSSSTITNYNLLAPPPNNIMITPNHTINNLFQFHQYNNHTNNMNMSNNTPSSSSWLDDDDDHNHAPHPFPESLSQLLLGGVYIGEEGKKMENWEEQVRLQQHNSLVDHLKQENSVNSYNNNNVYCNNDQEFQLLPSKATNWAPHHQTNIIPASSPQSCISTTTFSDNLHARHHNPLPLSDHSSECNSAGSSGGALKKPKVQPSSTQPTFKVRKEKLGDRITALHQLVSPFGKTDTASVLLEAIGYVRFLHSQIEALSLPYLTNGAGDKSQPLIVKGERKCIFPEDPGQLLNNNDNGLKRKGGPDKDSYEEVKDLRSRGLCLVPLSSTMHVGSDNGADYWAPAIGGGGFR